jgi:flagellar basal body P-ring protein FlgI
VASNEKTGTIFAGEHVTLSEVALASENLKIENAELAISDMEKTMVSCSIGPGAAKRVNIIRMQIRENMLEEENGK